MDGEERREDPEEESDGNTHTGTSIFGLWIAKTTATHHYWSTVSTVPCSTGYEGGGVVPTVPKLGSLDIE